MSCSIAMVMSEVKALRLKGGGNVNAYRERARAVAVASSPVRRKLFDDGDKTDSAADARIEIERTRTEQEQRWGFSFVYGRPLEPEELRTTTGVGAGAGAGKERRKRNHRYKWNMPIGPNARQTLITEFMKLKKRPAEEMTSSPAKRARSAASVVSSAMMEESS